MLAVQINYNTLQESIRHNLATEQQARNELAETRRHNVTYENETMRHNLATETIEQAKLQETVRHNTQTEAVAWYEAETSRNLAQSQIALNTAKAGHENLLSAMDAMYLSDERQIGLDIKHQQIEETDVKIKQMYVNMLATQAGVSQGMVSALGSALRGGSSSIKTATDLLKFKYKK